MSVSPAPSARRTGSDRCSLRWQAGPVAKGLAAAVRLAASEAHCWSIWSPSRSF